LDRYPAPTSAIAATRSGGSAIPASAFTVASAASAAVLGSRSIVEKPAYLRMYV
jgi:hypothetical protein